MHIHCASVITPHTVFLLRGVGGFGVAAPSMASIRQHQYASGEARNERMRGEAFVTRRAGMLSYFGLQDPDGFEDALRRPVSSWSSQFNGPHLADGIFSAFSKYLEAGQHGDQHSLLADWTAKFGHESNGNFVIPFAELGWTTKPSPAWVLVCNNPDDHVRLASKHLKKSAINGAILYGQSFLAHVDNDEWRRRRFGSISSVSPSYIKTYFHRMERHAHALSERLLSEERSTFFYGADEPKSSVNLHEEMMHTAFSIAADSLFGANDAEIAAWSRPVRWALQNPEPRNRKALKILLGWAKVLQSIPEERKGPLLKSLIDLRNEPSEYHDKNGGSQAADAGLFSDVGLISLAMHDTTGNTMTFLLAQLAQRPELQAAVAEEARAVLRAKADQPGRPSAMEYDDLYHMPLLTKCINETLRLHPAVAYGSQRVLEHDEVLHCGPGPDDTAVVPAGTNFILHNFSNHRRKDLWGEDALDWKPERWKGFADEGAFNFAENEPGVDVYAARNPHSRRFHPFTRAPRQCFGMNFAQAEMRSVLPVLLSKLEFVLAEPTKTTVATKGIDSLSYSIVGILKPRDGLWVHVRRRAPATEAQDVASNPQEAAAPPASRL